MLLLDLEPVYDSGADFERITADAYPESFNSDHEENNFDNRSDSKAPEPEGVTIAKLWGRTYACIGLERIGGVMVSTTSPTPMRRPSFSTSTTAISVLSRTHLRRAIWVPRG